MKVNIGPYKSWFSPYHLVDPLKYLGVSEERRDAIGDYLDKTWVHYFCLWLEKKRKRTTKIHIDNYDIWGLDYTLAMIISPSLKLLKERKRGIPCTSVDDAPHIKDEEYYSKGRWEWILDEMIWAFDFILDEDMTKHTIEDYNRCNNGLRLFAKYYHYLMD